MRTGDTVLRSTIIPLLLMILSPPAVQFVWIVCYHYQGSIANTLSAPLSEVLSNFPSPTRAGASIVIGFLLAQLILLIIVPGATFVAIPTPMGNRPKYTLNGPACFVLTHAGLLAAHAIGVIRYGALYDHFGAVLAVLNKAALVVTVLLYIRGIYAPTNSDSGVTGHGIVWDMWHGTELHPEIWGVSLKQLINCRFAMAGWSVAVMAFAMKQIEQVGYLSNSMAVSTILQMVYILKFFLWEGGYFNSVDIIHDRFGFYIFWGCTAFLPSIYTLTSYYLTTHAESLHPIKVVLTTLIGVSAVGCNYWTDYQRQRFRHTNGKELIWGRKPVIIEARYKTGDGKERKSLLLASGWWGVSRHVNYVFELLLALSWSIPAGLGLIPYVYVLFLCVLLTDRAFRDEIRCLKKYGDGFRQYCDVVKWRMIPGVY